MSLARTILALQLSRDIGLQCSMCAVGRQRCATRHSLYFLRVCCRFRVEQVAVSVRTRAVAAGSEDAQTVGTLWHSGID